MCNFGHIVADPSSNRRCYCGNTGCLEVEAGGKSMVELVSQALAQGESSTLRSMDAFTPEAIAREAQSGDILARRILNRSAVLMARVLGGVLALLNPDTVVFGGGVSACLPLIRDLFDDELRRSTPKFTLDRTTLVESSFRENAGVVGASLLHLMRAK